MDLFTCKFSSIDVVMNVSNITGKDAKTVMLVHVSQREEDVNETVCSLNFAMRAKAIHLGKEVSLVRRLKTPDIRDLM